MKRFLFVTLLALGLIPLVLNAQDEGDIKEMLVGFRNCLQMDNYQKAVGYLSKDFLSALKTAAPTGQKEGEEGYAFLHQDPVDFVAKEMDSSSFENFEVVSVSQNGSSATAELKPADGKLVKIFLVKESTSGWKITLAPKNVFVESQKKDEARIKELDEKRHAIEWRQHLADDIGESRWDRGY